jgi:hypothetical protein
MGTHAGDDVYIRPEALAVRGMCTHRRREVYTRREERAA